MNARAMRGAALIAAILIAAIIAGIAVALTSRDQFSILAVSRLRETATVDDLVRELEVQAVRVLASDLEQSRHDGVEEEWHTIEMQSARGDLTAFARMEDAQRRFNLNALSFQPGDAADAGDEDLDSSVPPPVDETPLDAAPADAAPDPQAAEPAAGANGAATRALADVVPGIRGGTDGATSPAADPNGEEGGELSAQQIAVVRFHLLLQALDIPQEVVPALLDWLDDDSETRFPNGAEDDYYTRLDEPYRAANGPLADISELLLVRGMTAEIYAKLSPFITVLQPAVTINVNTAPAEILMSLGPGIDRATADLLVSSREIQPLVDLAALMKHPLLAGRPLLESGLTTSSSIFELRVRIEGEGPPVFHRSLIERSSPDRLRVVRRDRLYADG